MPVYGPPAPEWPLNWGFWDSMIGFDEAEQIAERFLLGLSSDAGIKLKLLRSETLERDIGWVFFHEPEVDALVGCWQCPVHRGS
jgi:hypothetical protein